jgi:glycogen debranching enzyme
VGQLSEIFDARAPHHPRGCVAQAWSAAEILRAWLRTSV